MNEKFDTATVDADGLELGLQELEALEAPGFWEGVSIGIAISTVTIAT
ncbi:daptide-type RiPP [Streptomyces sp. NPDC085946]